MPLPCNNVSVFPVKVSQLVRYSNLDGGDLLLTVESGSSLLSRHSTINDLKKSLGRLTGSYSGSFTGSFKGISSGSFSGSYWGRVISKNTKASGSFSGSFYGLSNFSKTSSYLRQTNQNTTNGVGYYDGTRLTSAPGLTFQSNVGGYKILNISSSLPFNFLNIASRGLTSGGTKYNQAGIGLFNYNSSEPYPTYDSWTLLSATSGSLTFIAPIGSNAFSSSTIKAQSTTGECYGMVQRRNGFYFWPYMASNTPSRDGAVGIGVQPPEEATGSFSKYLRAKLQINMFSGSGEGPWTVPATVENRATAILVNYGSGSTNTGFTPTFYVSSSGNTYIHGKLNVNRGITGSFRGIDNILNFKGTGKKVSVNATSSYAVSSSYAVTSSFANQAKSASYIAEGGLIFSNNLINSYTSTVPTATGVDYQIGTLTVPAGKTLKWFRIEGSAGTYESQGFYLYGLKIGSTLITSNVYSSWGWGNYLSSANESDGDFTTRSQFTIEGKPTSGTNTGTLTFYINGTAGQTVGYRGSGIYGYVVGYY